MIADVLAEEADESDDPFTIEEIRPGTMYYPAFAQAEERVAARNGETMVPISMMRDAILNACDFGMDPVIDPDTMRNAIRIVDEIVAEALAGTLRYRVPSASSEAA